MNQRRRSPADLQSAPFSHLGTPPLMTAWSWRWESNPKPADYKSAALPLSYASATLVARFQSAARLGAGRSIIIMALDWRVKETQVTTAPRSQRPAEAPTGRKRSVGHEACERLGETRAPRSSASKRRSRYFSSLRFTRWRALSMDFTWRVRSLAISW